MNLKDYGIAILLSSLGIPNFYRPYIHDQDENLELIAKYLKGELIDKTNHQPLSPEVNILMAEIENELIKSLPPDVPYIQKWYWPDWKEYALCISHDIDKISESRKHIWKIRKRFSKMTVLKALFGISNPYNNFKKFVKMERQYGVSSSFYFLAYQYNLKKILSEINLLKLNDMELGLHGGFGTHTGFDQLIDEKKHLEEIFRQKIFGIRHHFLKFEFPTTWNIQNQAELLYDTTIGFNDKIGFKIGMALPFFAPTGTLNPPHLVELPLIIMDAAIWTWLKLDETLALQTILQLQKQIIQYHGLLTILWHQCTLKMRGGRIYEHLLKNLVNKSAYIAKGAEIAQWWRGRNDFRIEIKSQDNGITVSLDNPRRIRHLGITIRIKSKMEISSVSPNIKIINNTHPILKLLFKNGESSEFILKNI